MKNFTISLNPIYLCNFRCKFCYLTESQLRSNNTIEIIDIIKRFEEVSSLGINISHVDLYGGEIALLSQEYLEEVHEYIKKRHQSTINVVTNLSIINPYFLRDDVTLSVSFDFDAREKYDRVLSNIIKIDKDISILMLASPELISKDVGEMINVFSSIENIVSVEIKPYSTNQANHFPVTYKEYEDFVLKWIQYPEKKFEFINEKNIKNCLDGKYNAYSDNHIYITPNNKFAVLEFDEKDREYFLEMNSIYDYLAWSQLEKNRVKENSYCNKCEFLGKCLTEHYRQVDNLDNSCNGFYNLLDNHYFSN